RAGAGGDADVAGRIPLAVDAAIPGRRRLRHDPVADGPVERGVARIIAPRHEGAAGGSGKGEGDIVRTFDPQISRDPLVFSAAGVRSARSLAFSAAGVRRAR